MYISLPGHWFLRTGSIHAVRTWTRETYRLSVYLVMLHDVAHGCLEYGTYCQKNMEISCGTAFECQTPCGEFGWSVGARTDSKVDGMAIVGEAMSERSLIERRPSTFETSVQQPPHAPSTMLYPISCCQLPLHYCRGERTRRCSLS